MSVLYSIHKVDVEQPPQYRDIEYYDIARLKSEPHRIYDHENARLAGGGQDRQERRIQKNHRRRQRQREKRRRERTQYATTSDPGRQADCSKSSSLSEENADPVVAGSPNGLHSALMSRPLPVEATPEGKIGPKKRPSTPMKIQPRHKRPSVGSQVAAELDVLHVSDAKVSDSSGNRTEVLLQSAARQHSRVNEIQSYLMAEAANIRARAHEIFEAIRLHSATRFERINEFQRTDGLGVLIRVADGVFVSKPNTTEVVGAFDVAYDGKRFVEIKQIPTTASQTNRYIVQTSASMVIVFDALRLFQSDRKLDTIPFSEYQPHSARITLVEGVPGAGKTTDIIRRATNGSLILTVARRTCQEIQERLLKIADSQKDAIVVRTVDSFLINARRGANLRVFDTVYLDEGLMIHPGEIDLIAWTASASRVFVYGDRAQLNFISRVAGFDIKHTVYDGFADYEFQNVSYRCPQDVCAALFTSYPGRMFTHSAVRRSMQAKEIANVAHVPRCANTKYLTFTQQEKKDLSRAGFADVNTVHEVQGMTFASVGLVRLNPTMMTIYDSKQHALVAISRHTRSFVYYHPGRADAVLNFIRSVDMRINVTDTGLVARNAAKLASIEFEREKPVEDFPVAIRPLEYTQVYAPLERHDQPSTEERNEIALKILSVEQALSASPTVSDQMLPVSIVDSYYTRGRYQPVDIDIDVVSALQTLYDDALPGAGLDFHKFDEIQIETSELRCFVDDVRIDKSRIGQTKTAFRDDKPTYLARLRTAQPNVRPRTSRQTLLALSKRNCDVPKNALPVDINGEVQLTVKSFLQSFCIDGADKIMEAYQTEQVNFTIEGLNRWLDEQEMEKLRRIDVSNFIDQVSEIGRYTMMTKKEAKNKLEPHAFEEYLSVQNIVFHKPIINAIFGSVFKILFDRFIRLLRPNVFCMLRKSIEQLKIHLNTYLEPGQRYEKFEIDFSKFDKSQLALCYEFENQMYQLLGMDPYLDNIWKMGHRKTSAMDFQTGIKALLFYQRKSGDAATAFGNTLVSMASIARSTDIRGYVCAYFVGDDSLIFYTSRRNDRQLVKNLSDIFNLSAKSIEKKVGYFCSTFILDTPVGYVPLPDPLKRIERLGRDLYGIDEAGLKDRFVSFSELMQDINIIEIEEMLLIGMTERYGNVHSVRYALDALRAITSKFEVFRRLYQQGERPSVLSKIKTTLRI